MNLALGLLLALGSAVAINWGYYVQHEVAHALPPLSLRRPIHSLLALFTVPRWLIGLSAGIGGWVLYVVALKLAPLSLVQAAAAGGIAVLALLVSHGGTALERREVVGVAVSLLGLVLLGVSLLGTKTPTSDGHVGTVVLWLACSAGAAALAAGPVARWLSAGAGLGVAAGVLYAAGDVGTKAAVVGGPRLWLVVPVLACHATAFVALQFGFQRGGALATAGVATLFTNALPILAGTVLFAESLPSGVMGVLRVASFAAVVVGAALLAKAEAPESEPPRAPAPARLAGELSAP